MVDMNPNWTYGTLDDVVAKGSSNISLNKIKENDGDYPVYGAKGFVQNTSFYQQKSVYLAIIKDGAGIGRVSKHPEKSSVLATMQYILPKQGYDIDFVKYFLCHINFEKYRTGSTIPHVYYKDYKAEPFPLIELETQRQIVAVLDKAFAAIDVAQTNIEKNLQNAKELFQSKLNEIFTQKGEGWEEKKLGEVCKVTNGYAFKSKEAVESSNTQLLRMGNLYQNKLDLGRKAVFYPDSYAETYSEYLLKDGDLIMSLTGTVDKTDYGYTAKVTKVPLNLLLNQRIMKIDVLDEATLHTDYLHNYLLSPDFLERLYATANGTRQANLSSKTILTLSISFPSDLNQQESIVDMLYTMKNKSVELEKHYIEKLSNLEDLKKSMLQKAFVGKLT